MTSPVVGVSVSVPVLFSVSAGASVFLPPQAARDKVITSARDSANNFFILHLLLFIFFRMFPAKSRIPDSINLAQTWQTFNLKLCSKCKTVIVHMENRFRLALFTVHSGSQPPQALTVLMNIPSRFMAGFRLQRIVCLPRTFFGQFAHTVCLAVGFLRFFVRFVNSHIPALPLIIRNRMSYYK